MKLSVLHSTPRPGRITNLISPNEAQKNLHKQIGRSPIKDLPTTANVMYTIYAIALTIVFGYRRFYRRHFQCHDTRKVRTHVMSLPMHTLCHFLRNVSSYEMSVPTKCQFLRNVSSYEMSVPTKCQFLRNVTSYGMPPPTECQFLQNVSSYEMSVPTKCQFLRNVSSYVMSLPMYTIIQFFDHTFNISIQPLEPICNLYAVNEGGK